MANPEGYRKALRLMKMAEKFNMPISVVRPFNNYGPGMSIYDKRLPADLAKCIKDNKDIFITKNGKQPKFLGKADWNKRHNFLKTIEINNWDYVPNNLNLIIFWKVKVL